MGTGPLRPSLHVNTHDARVHRAVLCVESKISHKKRLVGFRAHARSGSAIIDIIDAKPMPVAATITKMNAVLEGRRLLLGQPSSFFFLLPLRLEQGLLAGIGRGPSVLPFLNRINFLDLAPLLGV